MQPNDIVVLIDRYCAAWNEPDALRRRELMASVWAEAATYTDPNVHAAGVDELLDHIARTVARRPGAKVVRTSRIDVHHGVARFGWRIVQADGSMLPEGLDLVDITADGKIGRIVGFFGPLVSD